LKSSWCVSVEQFGAGDRGTPGAENEWCPDLDRDGDLLSMAAATATISTRRWGRGARDVGRRRTTTATGLVDDITIDAADSTFLGAEQDMLGLRTGSGSATGAATGSRSRRRRNLRGRRSDRRRLRDRSARRALRGRRVRGGRRGRVDSGHDSYAYLGAVDPQLGDNDGDTEIDLVVAGASSVDGTIGGWFQGASLSGALSIDDADVTFEGSTGSMYMDRREPHRLRRRRCGRDPVRRLEPAHGAARRVPGLLDHPWHVVRARRRRRLHADGEDGGDHRAP
jgi:hypothetical protein